MNPSTQPFTPAECAEFTWRVSTRSSTTGGNCVEVGWRTSTRSSNAGGSCVEVGPVLDSSSRVAVRDSKDRAGGALAVNAPQWTSFLTAVRSGDLEV